MSDSLKVPAEVGPVYEGLIAGAADGESWSTNPMPTPSGCRLWAA